jgi:hypothetical protein
MVYDADFAKEWNAFFPAATKYDDQSAVSMPLRETLLRERSIVSSDGVYTDRRTSVEDECYARFIDGTLRVSLRLSHSPLALDAPEANPPLMVYVPPETSLYVYRSHSATSPKTMSGTMPSNPSTPFVRHHYEQTTFLMRTGGVGPAAFPNLQVLTSTGARPPKNGDELFVSAFFLAQMNGQSYFKPDFDIESFYLLNGDGMAVL